MVSAQVVQGRKLPEESLLPPAADVCLCYVPAGSLVALCIDVQLTTRRLKCSKVTLIIRVIVGRVSLLIFTSFSDQKKLPLKTHSDAYRQTTSITCAATHLASGMNQSTHTHTHTRGLAVLVLFK